MSVMINPSTTMHLTRASEQGNVSSPVFIPRGVLVSEGWTVAALPLLSLLLFVTLTGSDDVAVVPMRRPTPFRPPIPKQVRLEGGLCRDTSPVRHGPQPLLHAVLLAVVRRRG